MMSLTVEVRFIISGSRPHLLLGDFATDFSREFGLNLVTIDLHFLHVLLNQNPHLRNRSRNTTKVMIKMRWRLVLS